MNSLRQRRQATWNVALLASLLVSIAGVSAASAASFTFGTGVYGAIWDPANNESDSDYFDRDPDTDANGDPLSFDGNSILTPFGESHGDGITEAAISLTRSGARVAGSANLATGELTAYANGDAPYTDSLTVGFADTLTPLADGVHQFDLTVTGTNSGSTFGGGIWFAVDGTIYRGQLGEVDSDPCLSDVGSISCLFTFVIPVQAGSSYTFIWALQVYAPSGTVDWENTATIAVSGVPYTSASGVFLSEVAEPTSLSLLIAGVAGLVVRRRRSG
jgi:hypothetical protein